MIFCATVDDVGYDGYSTVTDLARLLDFYDGHGVRGTLFVVPRNKSRVITKCKGYVTLLRRALAQGHEIAQHGLSHDRFEFGIPPGMVLSLPHEGPARERLKKERPEIMRNLTVGKIRRRLAEGRDILQEVIGSPVRGFRSPCLSVCDNLSLALAEEDYTWDSSLFFRKPGGTLSTDFWT